MKLFTRVRSTFSYLFVLVAFIGLQACSGGSGSSTPVTPTDAKPTGYYDNTGTVTVDDDGAGGGTTAINDLQAMINDKRFMMISDAQGLIYDGTITSISTNDFAANVSIFKHGQPITNPNATITGTITEKSKIEGSLKGTGAGNSSVDFSLQYADNNNQVAVLTRIDKNHTQDLQWESEIGGAGIDTTRFRIEPTGVINFSAPASNGFFASCLISSGTFSPISGTSLYDVTMNVTNCTDTTANLTYVGLAASRDRSSADGFLIIGVTDSNSIYSINGDFKF